MAFGGHLIDGTRRRVLAGLAAFIAVVVGLVVVTGAAWSSEAQQRRCDRLAAARLDRAAEVTGSGESVLVIGDSWSAGRGLDHPADSWPSQLPGRVHVDGFTGSGFSRHASPCASRAYADRVDAALRSAGGHPSLVVLQGGLNETDRPAAAIRSGVRRVLARLEARGIPAADIVIVGPVAAPRRAGGVPRVDRVLAQESSRAHVRYLSMTRVRLPYLPDRLHPTAAGHAEFGRAVAALL